MHLITLRFLQFRRKGMIAIPGTTPSFESWSLQYVQLGQKPRAGASKTKNTGSGLGPPQKNHTDKRKTKLESSPLPFPPQAKYDSGPYPVGKNRSQVSFQPPGRQLRKLLQRLRHLTGYVSSTAGLLGGPSPEPPTHGVPQNTKDMRCPPKRRHA